MSRIFLFVIVLVFAVGAFGSLDVFGQSNFSPPKSKLVNDLSFTYGYSMAQRARVEKLALVYPDLEEELRKSQMLWERVFGSSVDSIGRAIKSLATLEAFTSMDSSMRAMLAKEELSHEQAVAILASIKRGADGDFESPLIETLLSYDPAFNRYPAEEFSANFSKTYSSLALKDATDGVDIRMKFPRSWNSRETPLPTIVRGFSSKNGRGTVSVALFLIDMRKEMAASRKRFPKLKASDLEQVRFTDAELKNMVKNPRDIVRGKTFISGNAAGTVEFTGETPQLDLLVTVFQRCYYFVKQDRLFLLSCSVAKDLNDSEAVFKGNIKRNRPLFEQMAASVAVVYPRK